MHIEGTLGCKVLVLLVDGDVCILFSVVYIVCMLKPLIQSRVLYTYDTYVYITL